MKTNFFPGAAMLTACWWACSVAHAQDAMPVSVMRIVSVPIAEEVRLTGDLRARRTSLLSSEVDGIVRTLSVDDGSVINKGDPIVSLDDDLARIAQQTARAGVAEAEARLAEAERRHAELTQLKKRQHVPQTNVESAQSEIKVARAVLARARSDLSRADTLLRKHRVAAPFAGVINRKLVEVGQWVDTSTALVELVETEFLRLEIPVPQYYFGSVDVGTPVSIRFDPLPGREFLAEVSAKIPVSDNAARTFPIRIDLQNTERLLAPGMSAKVVLRVGGDTGRHSKVVARDAIVRKPNGTQSIWTVIQEDGVTKAEPKEIETGRSYRDAIEILSEDIQEGMLVVVRGNEILRPGQSITVAEEISLSD